MGGLSLNFSYFLKHILFCGLKLHLEFVGKVPGFLFEGSLVTPLSHSVFGSATLLVHSSFEVLEEEGLSLEELRVLLGLAEGGSEIEVSVVQVVWRGHNI